MEETQAAGIDVQEHYHKAIYFATGKHIALNQTIPGTNYPYVVHLSNGAMEILMAAPHSAGFDLNLAIQVALLHDILEDTIPAWPNWKLNLVCLLPIA